jgi:hypothetical protein
MVKRLLAASALVLGLGLAACEEESATEEAAEEVEEQADEAEDEAN